MWAVWVMGWGGWELWVVRPVLTEMRRLGSGWSACGCEVELWVWIGEEEEESGRVAWEEWKGGGL